eukprot:1160616-Pelagomonas_calceolata.AAC.1
MQTRRYLGPRHHVSPSQRGERKHLRSMKIRRLTSSNPSLIWVTRVGRSLLDIESGACKL